MDQHISFGDLVTFVWMDALTPETKANALRVNQHLLTCPQCRAQAERLEQLHQEAETLRRNKQASLRPVPMGRVIAFRQAAPIQFSAADDPKPQVLEEGEIPILPPEEEPTNQ